MKTLTEIISALVEENRVARQAHRAKVEKRAEELNAGWAKTRFGREYFDKVVAPTWAKTIVLMLPLMVIFGKMN